MPGCQGSAANFGRKNWPSVAALKKFADSCRMWCANGIGLFWFVSVCFLAAIAGTSGVFNMECFVAWGEEGASWAHKGSHVLLRQASVLGNVLGCKTAVGRAGGEHVLAFMSHEDGEMECSGGGALLYAQTGQSKTKGNY